MLKLFFVPAIVLFMFSSCKKTYTCTCNTIAVYKTSANNYTSQSFSGGPKAYSKKLSKKQAKDACRHMEGTVQTNVINWLTDNGTYSFAPGESITTYCEIN